MSDEKAKTYRVVSEPPKDAGEVRTYKVRLSPPKDTAIQDVETHDRLTRELVDAVTGRELSYNADLATLARKLAGLMEHDGRTMTAREFQDTYGALEGDIRRAIRKWARER